MDQKNYRLFVDVHVLQTVPPSCLNRDDTGSPKTAVYGGVTRSRVSSQSWKRAMRTMFREVYSQEDLAYRTKDVMNLIMKALDERDYDGDLKKTAETILTSAGLKLKQNVKTGETSRDALFFISDAQVRGLAELVTATPDLEAVATTKNFKQKAQQVLKENPGIDVALFGRMVAEDPSLNTDACSQVAHAISTHRVNTEFDFFTAVDDLAKDDNAGAGHIGTVEFNSATLYRYATLAVHDLEEHLGPKTKEAVQAFIRAFVLSMPTGKQNTFANRTVPDALILSVRKDQPVNFVGAFERAIPVGLDGYVTESARRLLMHEEQLIKSFMAPAEVTYYIGSPFVMDRETSSLEEALGEIDKFLMSQPKQ